MRATISYTQLYNVSSNYIYLGTLLNVDLYAHKNLCGGYSIATMCPLYKEPVTCTVIERYFTDGFYNTGLYLANKKGLLNTEEDRLRLCNAYNKIDAVNLLQANERYRNVKMRMYLPF